MVKVLAAKSNREIITLAKEIQGFNFDEWIAVHLFPVLVKGIYAKVKQPLQFMNCEYT